MTYYQTLEAYIESLCEKHKLLLHKNGGNAFIPMLIVDEVTTVTSLKPTYVKMMDVSMTGQGEQRLNWLVQIGFLKNLPATATNAVKDETSRITQEIMFDFAARIQHELDEACSFITGLIAPTFDPVGLTDQSAIGWMYSLRFSTSMPDYNVNAWED